jgi:O-antigen/teichoic acid export membrane protein
MVFGGLALWFNLGYFGLIVASMIGVAILTYTCWVGVRELGVKPLRPNWADWPALIKASLPFGIVTFALGLSYKFDTVLLSVTRSDAEVGWYNVAYNLIFSCVMVSNVVNTALYPSLTRQSVAGAHALPAIYERALRYLMVLAIPLSIGIFVLSPELIPFLFKAENAPAAPALQILIWVVPFMYASEFLGYVVLIGGREKLVARSVVISTLINVAANTLVVPRYGYLAASVMTVLTEVILVGQYLYILRAQLRSFQWGFVLVRPLLAALGMGLVLWLSTGLPLWLHAPLGALAYALFLVVLGVLGKDELHFVRGLRSKEVVA